MQMIDVNKLVSHPRNDEFFDDIEGNRWEDFKKSIARRGIVEAITATEIDNKLMIISGHQRVNAAKELNILEIPCRIVHYPETDEHTGNSKEDAILEDLISTNILQRGIGNINPMKMAKCIVELERIYGIRNGGDRKSDEYNVNLKTQKDLAEQINLTQQQLNRYKNLLNLIPELQDLVESDEIKSTVAYKIWAKLSPTEQQELFNYIGKDNIKKLTQKETQILIDEINTIKKEKDELAKKNTELLKKQCELHDLQKKLENELKNQSEQIKEVEVIIDNTDYNKVDILEKNIKENKLKIKRLEEDKDILERKVKLNEKEAEEYKNLKKKIDYLKKEKSDLHKQIESVTSISSLVVDIENLLQTKLAPVKYSRAIQEQNNDKIVIDNLTEIIDRVNSWCKEMYKLLPNKNYIDVEVINE